MRGDKPHNLQTQHPRERGGMLMLRNVQKKKEKEYFNQCMPQVSERAARKDPKKNTTTFLCGKSRLVSTDN